MTETITITPDQHKSAKERIKDALVKAGHVAEVAGEAAAEVALIALAAGAFAAAEVALIALAGGAFTGAQ